jgi:glycosyltransferase involved in cell wall biosynthesis
MVEPEAAFSNPRPTPCYFGATHRRGPLANPSARGAPTNVRHTTRSLPNSDARESWPSADGREQPGSSEIQKQRVPSTAMKLVSIIVPLYKSEAFIRETLESVLAQTYSSFEIVVIDDGSPDKSADVCRSLGDPRIRVFSRRNTGPCRARNFGIAQAKGEYIAFIDHDDKWLPKKLERHLEHLNRTPQVGVSYGPSAFIDIDGERLGLYQVPRLTGIDAREILCRNPIGNGSVPLIRRELVEAVKFRVEREGQPEDMYFDDEAVGWEDVELWFRMAFKTHWKFEGIPDCLTLYRLVESGIAGDPEKKQAGFERGLERARRYAPEFIARHEGAARAYHLRYLARRLVAARDRERALTYAHRALRSHPGMLREEPGRTMATLAAAYALRALPGSMYERMERFGMQRMGKLQARRVSE